MCRLKFLLMHLIQWLIRKNNYHLAVLSLVLWWSGCCLLGYKLQPEFASVDSQGVMDASVLSINERCPTIQDCQRILPAKSPDKFPGTAQAKACGAVNSFFLRLERKPHLEGAPAQADIAAKLYAAIESNSKQFLSKRHPRRVDCGGTYLRCCTFLI